ncbi:Threonine--tRNA ligase [Labeo rohita]|uniref:Threonine--tRNA ligase n=1 Tax=Labeo rohita TaxID=84645 RepID=A0ABQ8LX07_LABRO|nr:Threonine--tRNA ligase [Labeo rohita]
MTLLSRSATRTHIKPQITHEPFRRTSAGNMKLINSCLTVLVFTNAVYSAAMRDAFEMNLPLDHTEPTQLSETDLATEKILDHVQPTDPTADFSNTRPKPNLVELADVAEERSRESSNSDSRLAEKASAEDSREGDSDKRIQLRTTLAESMSMDRTDMDTDVTEASNKHTDKATVMEDISSQEMDRLEENGRYRPPRTQKMLEKHNSVVTDTGRQNLDVLKEMDRIAQSFASRMNLKDQIGEPHDTEKHQQESRKTARHLDSPEFVDTPDRLDLDADSEEHGGGRGTSQTQISGIKAKLNYAANQETQDDSRELADRIPGCTETSVEHPMEQNNSLDAPNVDQKIQKDTMSYQNQLRKICPTKRVRASNNPTAQLDLDSPERANSELLDRDNSRERMETHVVDPL